MTENCKAFMELVSSNKEYAEKLMEINKNYPEKDGNMPELIKFANTLGIALTEDDFKEEDETYNLSDDELEAVSGGGTVVNSRNSSAGYSDCFCFMGGGGTSDENQKTCACIAAGCGEMTDYGKEMAAQGKYKYAGSKKDPVAMYCALAGTGGF